MMNAYMYDEYKLLIAVIKSLIFYFFLSFLPSFIASFLSPIVSSFLCFSLSPFFPPIFPLSFLLSAGQNQPIQFYNSSMDNRPAILKNIVLQDIK